MKKRRLNLRSAVDLTASVTMIAAAAALIWRAAATPPTFVSSVTRGQARSPEIPAEPIDISGLNVLGSEAARVVIIEFADFQCPFCVRFFDETLPELRAKYIDTGRVRFVLRHFPLERIHAEAATAAVAAECAGREKRFWEMHDSLFKSRGQLGMDTLVEAAAGLGISKQAFNTCLGEGERHERVRVDTEAAKSWGISGTPTFYLGVADNRNLVSISRMLIGVQPFERFKNALEAIMSSLRP